MLHQPGGEGSRADEHTDFDVPLLSRFGEVRRRDECLLVIDQNALGVKAGVLGRIRLERPGIVEQLRQS